MVSDVIDSREVQERERIVRRAQDLFFANGFSRVTTEEIARELGISKKTLYQHFQTKEELLRAAVELLRDELAASVAAVLTSRSLDFIEKLSGILEALGSMLSRLRQPFLSEIQRKAPDIWAELEEFRREKIFGEIEALIAHGSRRGMLRKEVDSHVFMQMFFTVAKTLLTPEAISQMSLSASEAFREILTVLLTGVLTDGSRERFEALQTSSRRR